MIVYIFIPVRQYFRLPADKNEVNIKPRLVLQILKEMARNIFPQADDMARDFYDNFGKAAIAGKIFEGIKK